MVGRTERQKGSWLAEVSGSGKVGSGKDQKSQIQGVQKTGSSRGERGGRKRGERNRKGEETSKVSLESGSDAK